MGTHYASRTSPQSSSQLPRFGSHPRSSAPLHRTSSRESSDKAAPSLSKSPAQFPQSRGYSPLTQQSMEQRVSSPYQSAGIFSSPQSRYSQPQSSPVFTPPNQSQQPRFSTAAMSPQSRFPQPPHIPQRFPMPSPPQQRFPRPAPPQQRFPTPSPPQQRILMPSSPNERFPIPPQQRFPSSSHQPMVATEISKSQQGRFVPPSRSPQQRLSTSNSPYDAARGPSHNQGLRSQSPSGICLSL